MVARGDGASLGESTWLAAIEGVYRRIEGLDAAGYRSSESDGWTRARGPVPTTHLSFWVFAGDEVVTAAGGTLVMRSRVLFACRYVAEEHPAHLARAHAAAYAVRCALQSRQDPRCLVGGWTPDYSLVEAGWILVDLAFDLHLPW